MSLKQCFSNGWSGSSCMERHSRSQHKAFCCLSLLKSDLSLLVVWCTDKQGSISCEAAALNTAWSPTRAVKKAICPVVTSPQLTHHRSQDPTWAEVFYMTDGDIMVSDRLPYGTVFPHLLWPSPWRKDAILLALASCLAHKGARSWWRRSQLTTWSSPPPSQLLLRCPHLRSSSYHPNVDGNTGFGTLFATEVQSVRCIVYLLTFILHKENTQ